MIFSSFHSLMSLRFDTFNIYGLLKSSNVSGRRFSNFRFSSCDKVFPSKPKVPPLWFKQNTVVQQCFSSGFTPPFRSKCDYIIYPYRSFCSYGMVREIFQLDSLKHLKLVRMENLLKYRLFEDNSISQNSSYFIQMVSSLWNTLSNTVLHFLANVTE